MALFVPVGLAVTLAGSRARAAATALGAAALPFTVEYAHYLIPSLGRACDAQDIWDNLFGLAIGPLARLLLGQPLRAAVRSQRSRRLARDTWGQ